MNDNKSYFAAKVIICSIVAFISVFIIAILVHESSTDPDTLENTETTEIKIEEKEIHPFEDAVVEEEIKQTETEVDKVEEPEEQIEEVSEPIVVATNYIDMDEDTIRDFAALVRLECGGSSMECKMAVASVIVNRMLTRNSSFYDIVYAPNQFTPVGRMKTTEATESCLEAVRHVIKHGPTIDKYVCYFRANYYFDWGDRYCNYTQIDTTYFSYDTRLKERLEADDVI